MKHNVLWLFTAIGLLSATVGYAGSPRDAIIASFADQAGVPLSAEAGKSLFLGQHSGSKPETPSCTTCHTSDPKATGHARTGKAIEPMAVSINPQRCTDPEKVNKWFRRNCNSVLGRACTPKEMGDILTYLSSL